MIPVLMLASVLGADPPKAEPAPVQYVLDVRLIQGDPLGSVSAGTQKLLSEPRLVTTGGKPAAFRVGGHKYFSRAKGPIFDAADLTPLGTECEFLPVPQADGKVQVELNVKSATVVKQRDGEDGVSVGSAKTSIVVPTGEWVKQRLSAASATDQTWLEWQVRPQQQLVSK